ncbi:MAG: FlgD immunoglobulin-like domain containing protein, partial [Calditrichaceae bacterium]
KEIAESWYTLNFDAPGGQVVVLSTARVEQYLNAFNQPISDDDDIRYVIDGTDYGWDTPNSFNADAQGTLSNTLLFEKTVGAGAANIDVYGEISPLLYDVTVLGSSGGGIVFNQEYNEIKSSSSPELWKEISFQTRGGEVAVYVSGAADEDPTPSPSFQHGYQYSHYSDDEDDDIRIELDGIDYGYRTENSLYGNRLFGEPKSVLITENLTSGTHTLRIYGQGTPELLRVLIYGEMDDASLPVSLTKFSISPEKHSNLLTWQTASEINNLGFNIYRSVSMNHADQMSDAFAKINTKIIPGAGTSSYSHDYQFEDKNIESARTYWYYLEDISISGEITLHDTLRVTRAIIPQKFTLSQNYPNPFNGITTIEFTLSEKLNLNLDIYSSSGEKIRTLTKDTHEPGNYSYDWNGVNSDGHSVASGVYYVRLSTPSGQAADVKKIVYIK